MNNNDLTEARMTELFYNLLFHVSECVSESDLPYTLHAIGFTDEEIKMLFDL